MCIQLKNNYPFLFNFDNELYSEEIELMKANREKLLKSIKKGEKKLIQLFNNNKQDGKHNKTT